MPQGQTCDCILPSDDDQSFNSDEDLEIAERPCCGKPDDPELDIYTDDEDWNASDLDDYSLGSTKVTPEIVSAELPATSRVRKPDDRGPGAGWAFRNKKTKTSDYCKCRPTGVTVEGASNSGSLSAILKDKAYCKYKATRFHLHLTA
jgi:hypothetical protein